MICVLLAVTYSMRWVMGLYVAIVFIIENIFYFQFRLLNSYFLIVLIIFNCIMIWRLLNLLHDGKCVFIKFNYSIHEFMKWMKRKPLTDISINNQNYVMCHLKFSFGFYEKWIDGLNDYYYQYPFGSWK